MRIDSTADQRVLLLSFYLVPSVDRADSKGGGNSSLVSALVQSGIIEDLTPLVLNGPDFSSDLFRVSTRTPAKPWNEGKYGVDCW